MFHCKLCNHIKLQNRIPNPSVRFINYDKVVELIFIYITFQATNINICKLYGGMSWWFQGTYGHMDNPPDRFRGTCCYLFREKHNLPSPYFHTCLALKHMNSVHRPSVLSKGRERETRSTGISWIIIISKPSLFN